MNFDLDLENTPTISEPQTIVAGRCDALARLGQYDVLKKLGGGGFGVVYLARDTVSGENVAIKTLHPLLKSNSEEMENLRRKFSMTSELLHKNIAASRTLYRVETEPLYSDERTRAELRVGRDDFVMVMTYAPGVTLSKWRRQFLPSGRVPFDLTLEVAGQIASALDFAHAEGVVHRDIKPENVMVETLAEEAPPSRVESSKLKVESSGAANQHSTFQPAGARVRVRLLDFGLAAHIRSSMLRVSSEIRDTSGTRPYMAPEQWFGRKQDGRTDQYALACVIYEMLSGVTPFSGVFETGDPIIMRSAVEHGTPEEIDGLPESVNATLRKALAKDPKDRFASCGDFVAAMRDTTAQPHHPTTAPSDVAGRPAEPEVATALPHHRTTAPSGGASHPAGSPDDDIIVYDSFDEDATPSARPVPAGRTPLANASTIRLFCSQVHNVRRRRQKTARLLSELEAATTEEDAASILDSLSNSLRDDFVIANEGRADYRRLEPFFHRSAWGNLHSLLATNPGRSPSEDRIWMLFRMEKVFCRPDR